MSKANNKLELNEHGVSAEKAEACIAESCDNGTVDVGQSASVPVGQKTVSAPHFDDSQESSEMLNNSADEKAEDAPKSESAKHSEHKESCKSDEKAEHKESCKSDEKAEHKDASKADHHLTDGIEVAAGLALMIADQAGKAIKDVSKSWEDTVDAAALKAHETIESAQRAIKDPVGETIKQVDTLTHPAKSKAKK